MIKGGMQIYDHHHPGFNRDAEQCDVPHPDGDAEVVAKQPLQNQPAGHRIKSGENQYKSLNHGMENHKEQHENDEEDDGHDDLQPFLGANFELIFAGPLVGIACRQLELLGQHV